MHGFPPGFRALGSGYLLGVPVPIYLMAGVPRRGRAVHALHDLWARDLRDRRQRAKRRACPASRCARGCNLVYMLSGAMAGLAAIVYLARLNSAEADIGEPLTLPAIAAVLIGGTSLFGGVGSLSGTLVGAVILALVSERHEPARRRRELAAARHRRDRAARGLDRYRDDGSEPGRGLEDGQIAAQATTEVPRGGDSHEATEHRTGAGG